MDNDPGILCFRHCASSIFCYSVPQICPICRRDITNDNSILPYRVPFPFVRASQTPYSIVLKPSMGNFLDVYNVHADLHIGITTSSSQVIEYDLNGLLDNETNSWNESLCVYTLNDISWRTKWNDVLREVSDRFRNYKERYDEDDFNCYSFVLEFIQAFQHRDFERAFSCKQDFCREFVIPKMTTACNYVRLFRRLKQDEFLIEE